MAKATRKQALGIGLSKLINEVDTQKQKEAAILKTENDFLREQLKDCREQLAYTQSIVTSSLAMQQKIIDAFPEKPKKMTKASNKLTIEDARVLVNKAFKIED
jgi:cell division septum initiation protein DivIVA